MSELPPNVPPNPAPLPPEPPIAPAADVARPMRQEEEEHEATARLLHAWSLLPGRFPALTLLLVAAAIAITGFKAIADEKVYHFLYATPTEVWADHKWWGLLGSVFIHGGLMHLIFNCYWIWVLGRLIERELGLSRYAGLFLLSAWISSIAELACSGEVGVGLSGVAYAFFGFLLVNRSRHRDFERVLSGKYILLFLGWLVACFPLTYFGALRVANFAHLGGLLAGCVLGFLAYPNRWRMPARWAAAALGGLSFVPLFWAPQHEFWRMVRAERAVAAGDDARALELLPTINGDRATQSWAQHVEGVIRLRRKEYGLARDRLLPAAAISGDRDLLNTTAWLLATCPQPAIRDGARAIELARRACDLDQWKNPAYIDTLAAACAEAGEFSEAEKWALKALENPGKSAPELQKHLEAFRAHKPWREP